ncbi:ATPase, T2SS/T4P/T4SS family [Nocardioides sp.]|uniref:ATPase, T2SS/T4P/T4SS family n=1 Tax=Nocardioides sp. TaxID=35761 RepID=UPI0039E2CA9E
MSAPSTRAELAGEVIDEVREWLARSPGDLTPHRVAAALRATGRPVGDATVLEVHEQLRRETLGAGVLEPLLRLPGVTDVLVNGPDQVLLDRGAGLEATGVSFPDEGSVRRLAQRLAAGAGRRLDDASPYVDVRLSDGTRLHAVLAPLARPGTLISLRVPSRRTLPLSASVPERLLPVISTIVARRRAFLVSGGTGSGKTTLLSAMLAAVPTGERIVIVEDASELRPAQQQVPPAQ